MRHFKTILADISYKVLVEEPFAEDGARFPCTSTSLDSYGPFLMLDLGAARSLSFLLL